ncbi:MAG: rRNA adenine N-6-methyltransferase family protein [Candidatus Pacearchaeota archaeon]|jgi:16S rRNA (adenine1518-N6/adenine1519-N6)-dimethyltransferase
MQEDITPDLDKDQHFLINQDVLKKEIKAADLSENDRVIEIGAGNGTLTKELVKKAKNVMAFEIDQRFKLNLEKIKKDNTNLILVYDNALKFDWRGYNKIVSNIPYSLSEPVIMKAIEDNIDEIVLIVGENFKELLTSESTKIGVISNIFFEITPILKVKKEDFEPKPRVESWLIKLKRKKDSNVSNILIKSMLLKKGKIKNAILYSLVETGKTKNESRLIISQLAIDEKTLDKPVAKVTGNLIIKIKKELEKIK